ncbi:MAG: hypothetical protein ABIG71_02560 [Candidatus Uhrbacteria bacterium]
MCERVLSACLFVVVCAWPTSAASQWHHPLDALQKTQRRESVDSLMTFMWNVRPLEASTIRDLMHARLANAEFVFSRRGGEDSFVRTGLLLWTLFVMRIGEMDQEQSWSVAHQWLMIHIVPDTDMRALMRARDEYARYSGEVIPDERLTYLVSGHVQQAKLRENGYLKVPSNTFPLWRTVLDLDLGAPHFGWLIFRANDPSCSIGKSIPDFTRLFEQRTAAWIRYYMGQGERPVYLRDGAVCGE